MRPQYFNLINRRVLIFALLLVKGTLFMMPAYSQIDYGFGLKTSGLRVSAGFGVSKLITHYNDNPLGATFVASGDYDFNPYFSIGIQGQIGTLKGIDDSAPPKFYYNTSTNAYKSANFNIKAAVGLFTDFHANNGFQDAVKRIYLGVGYGVLKNDITFTRYAPLMAFAYGTPQPFAYSPTIPISFGTYITLPNVFGYDKIEINPNYTLTYVSSEYLDGFVSNPYSHLKGFYDLVSVSVRYKF